MNNFEFRDLVFKSIKKDKVNFYDACINIKEHYGITEDEFIEFFEDDRTLKENLFQCCSDLNLVDQINKSLNIDDLF